MTREIPPPVSDAQKAPNTCPARARGARCRPHPPHRRSTLIRRRQTGFALITASLILTGCASAHQTSPTAGLARTGHAAYPGNTLGPALVAGDALAFDIMLAHGYDTPGAQGPRIEARYANAASE